MRNRRKDVTRPSANRRISRSRSGVLLPFTPRFTITLDTENQNRLVSVRLVHDKVGAK
jgi:hypothetical protein